MLVLLDCDGSHAWHLPDSAMAVFTGEDAAKVNQRAMVRNKIELESATKTQVIEIACDSDRKGSPKDGIYSETKPIQN